jgi:hypothetical protein
VEKYALLRAVIDELAVFSELPSAV